MDKDLFTDLLVLIRSIKFHDEATAGLKDYIDLETRRLLKKNIADEVLTCRKS